MKQSNKIDTIRINGEIINPNHFTVSIPYKEELVKALSSCQDYMEDVGIITKPVSFYKNHKEYKGLSFINRHNFENNLFYDENYIIIKEEEWDTYLAIYANIGIFTINIDDHDESDRCKKFGDFTSIEGCPLGRILNTGVYILPPSMIKQYPEPMLKYMKPVKQIDCFVNINQIDDSVIHTGFYENIVFV